MPLWGKNGRLTVTFWVWAINFCCELINPVGHPKPTDVFSFWDCFRAEFHTFPYDAHWVFTKSYHFFGPSSPPPPIFSHRFPHLETTFSFLTPNFPVFPHFEKQHHVHPKPAPDFVPRLALLTSPGCRSAHTRPSSWWRAASRTGSFPSMRWDGCSFLIVVYGPPKGWVPYYVHELVLL